MELSDGPAKVDSFRLVDTLGKTAEDVNKFANSLNATVNNYNTFASRFENSLIGAAVAMTGLGSTGPAHADGLPDPGFEIVQGQKGPAADKVVKLPNPVMGAEDFSYVIEQVPGTMMFLGATPLDRSLANVAPNHSNRVMFDESAMATGTALYAAAAVLDEALAIAAAQTEAVQAQAMDGRALGHEGA